MGLKAEEWKVSGSECAGVHVSEVNRGNGGSVTDYSSSVKGRREGRARSPFITRAVFSSASVSLSHVMKVHVSSSLLLNGIQAPAQSIHRGSGAFTA